MEIREKGFDPPLYAVIDEDRPCGPSDSDGICAWVWAWAERNGAWHWYCRWHRSLICDDVRAVVAHRAALGQPRYHSTGI